jgi:hypothetical protein
VFKKILATAVAILIGAGLSLVAVAAPASAHTGALSGVAACQPDGTWTVTWTYTQTNTPSSGTGSQADVKIIKNEPQPSLIDGVNAQKWINAWTEHANSNGQTNIPTRTGNWTQTFVQSGIAGTASKATVMVQTDWKGWGSVDTEKTINLTGGCAQPVTVQGEPSVTTPTCDVPGHLVVPTQTGIVWSGGANGAGPGSYTMVAAAAPGYKLTAPYSKQFVVLAATGGCTIPVTVSGAPSATPPTCDVDGKLVVPTQTGILWSGGTNGAGPGTYTLVASAAPGYTLTAPYSKQVVVLAATGGCVIPVTVSGAPSATPPTCDVDGKLVVPTQTGILWSGGTNGAGPGTYTLVASAAPGYTLTAPYSKQVVVNGATLDCPVTVSAFPSVIPPTCLVDGHLVVPTQNGVVFTGGTNGAGPGSYTITASAAPGYALTAPYSITIIVKPADTTLCIMEPKASVQVGTCVPEGDISQKPVLFTFDNSESELAVTFTIPSIPGFAPVVVAAGAVSGPIAGPNVNHLTGASWQVFANGELLTTLTVAPFDQCQDELTPGDPSSTPEECVAGEVTKGSITILPSPGKISYTITGGPGNVNLVVDNNTPKTDLPAGEYVVTAHGINGFVVGPENTWTYPIEVLEPAGCEKIAIPVSSKSNMECTESGSALGTYTLPSTDSVEWYVGGVLKTTPSNVFFPGDVVVEARITQAGKDAGIFFTDGTQSHTVTHTFTLPEEDCTPTLALLSPTASQQAGSCTVLPTYTLSNTTSEHGGVQWKVGDPQTNTTAGVHQASWASTVKVEATLVDPVNDGFAPEQQTTWEFTFPAKPTACGDLITLALTGATGGSVLWIAGALLLLGGAGIYFTRRKLAATK